MSHYIVPDPQHLWCEIHQRENEKEISRLQEKVRELEAKLEDARYLLQKIKSFYDAVDREDMSAALSCINEWVTGYLRRIEGK